MNKVEFIANGAKASFVLGKIKYIMECDRSTYWIINRAFYALCQKINKSEYDEECNTTCSIKIDNGPLPKQMNCFYVDHTYSMDEDLKLGAKSILLRYLLSKMEKQMYEDEFLQLNPMLEVICDSLSDELVKFNPEELNNKLLTKFIVPFVIKDGYTISGANLSYEEIIVFQLHLIQGICNKETISFVLIDLMYLSPKIIKEIDNLENVIAIVICHTLSIDIKDKENIWINGIDLEDEENLYERMNSMTNFIDLKEYKLSIINNCFTKICK